MGKAASDKTQAEILEPLVVNPKTLNNYDDNTILNPQVEVQTGTNVIFDNKIIEKIPGTTKQNSDTPGDAVMGLHRSYGKTTEKVTLRLANGTLKSGPAAFGTTVLSSLATDKRTPFINIKGKAYGVNETDGIIRYDPRIASGQLQACVGPALRKKIAFFESDETWTGGSADNSAFRPEEWTGNATTGLKLSTANPSDGDSSVRTVSLDLLVFNNSKVSDENDLIVFWTKHTIRANINYIKVEFRDTDSNSYSIEIYQSELTPGDYEWTEHKIRKGAFTKTVGIGALTWDEITDMRLQMFTNANGGSAVTFDYMYLAASKITGTELQKLIFDCEDNVNEVFSGDGTKVQEEAYIGNTSIRVAGTVAGAARSVVLGLSTALDLTEWVPGSDILGTDEFVFYVRCNDLSAWTDANCLTLAIGQDGANYYYYTWATKTALGVTGKQDQWVEVRVSRATMEGLSVGAPSWTNVDYAALATSTLTGTTKYVYYDYLTLRKVNNLKQIATMESSEAWSFSNAQSDFNSAEGKVTEGLECIKIANPGHIRFESTAQLDFSPVKNLTVWDDASASDTSDSIAFDIYAMFPNHVIEYLEIWFDRNSGTSFANAYKYRFTTTDFAPLNDGYNQVYKKYRHFKGTFSIPKSSFDTVGTLGGWGSIGSVKFIVMANSYLVWRSAVYIDNLRMVRKVRNAGTYYYKYAFKIKDVFTACSDISEPVSNRGNDILLKNIKASQDSRVTARAVLRIGGTYPDTWMYVKTIEDNTTTSIVDDVNDKDLLLAEGDEIPKGWINIVKGNNLVYEPQSDRLLVWGDPDHKNYVWYSAPGYYMSFSEDGFRELPDHVMHVVPWYGQDIVFYKNKAQKAAGSIYDGELGELPINVGPCTYWAVRPLKNVIPFAGWDNVYIFDGYNIQEIGNEVRGYFRGRESYLTDVVLGYNKDTLYVACMDKTGTPTYNNVVLRYSFKEKGWNTIPWNVNIWANLDQADDNNDLYYGDSVTGNIYSLDSATYRFDATAITSTLKLAALMFPESELRLVKIELKAKGTASSTIAFTGYKNLSAVAGCSGTITLTTSWQTFVLGKKNIANILVGDVIELQFVHNTDNAYFKMKDITLYIEKIPKRTTLNEITVS